MSEISVIVPVYKVEKYIDRCINSILSQSYGDFDLVLIDDGSPDNCGIICDSYEAKDNRIHVIHQTNKGLSAARNAGIDWALANSNSEWISFIDSDDWIHPLYLEALLKAATETKSDISLCGYYRTNGEDLPYFSDFSVLTEDVSTLYLNNITSATVSWGKLIKKKYFKEIKFPEGKIHEDEFTSYRLLFQQKHVAVINQALYAYFQNANGIIRGKWTPSRLDHLESLEQQVKFFENSNYIEIAKARFLSLLNNNLKNQNLIKECDLINDDDKKYLIKKLKRQLRRMILKYRSYNWVPFKKSEWNKSVYTNAFIGIRIARVLWGKLKAILKGVPITLFIGKRVKFIWRRRSQICYYFKYLFKTTSKKAVLINSPLYRNLGDQAIALAEIECLDKLNVPYCDFPWTHEAPELFAKSTNPNKLVLFQGGGNLGQLWLREEKRFRDTLKAYKRNPIIVFPQTIYFDLDSDEGKECFKESKAIYESHPNLLIFVRENNSLSFMKEHMPNINVCLVPDMVMSLNWTNPHIHREGVLVCLRRDKEQILSETDYNKMLVMVGTHFTTIAETDTVSPGDMPIEDRRCTIEKKLSEFSAASLVITDRLHGMIFAAITETPCIVLNSLSYKIRGCYKWIEDLDYIKFAETVDDVPNIIKELKDVKAKYNRETIEEAMKPLYEALIEATK